MGRMYRLFAIFLVVCMLFSLNSTFFSVSAAEGDNPSIPIIINNRTQLSNIRNNPNAHYKLGNNIDLGNDVWTPIPTFSGSLDGAGFIISNLNLSISSSSNVDAGLFGRIYGGTIKNLGITINSTGTSVSSPGRANVGGIVGFCEGGILHNSFVIGDITATATNVYLGGLAGVFSGNISKCYTTGDFTISIGSSGGLGYVGGVAAYSYSPISNSYSVCNLTVNASTQSVIDAGGLVGCANGATITNCYASAAINAPYGGGFAAVVSGGTISSSYYDSTKCSFSASVSGQISGVTAKSSSALKSQSSFSSWDFMNVWNISISKNNGFPFLRSVAGTNNTHSISVANMENGTVIPICYNASAGTTISISIIPNNNYRLASGTLKYNGKSIKGNTFSMPDIDVTITASFEASPNVQTEPIVFANKVTLNYPKKGLLGIPLWDDTTQPPIPSGNDAKYADELRAWADELEYDLSEFDINKLLKTPLAVPYVSTGNEVFMNVSNSQTVKTVMSDIIMLGKL
ncbi:MAG: hypothetical protein GX638_14495, partial [Crenarchaeota archaeon]|nr:hypothetical protein [Thermoproteota archaeon]